MKITKKWLAKHNACRKGTEWLESQEEREGVDVIKALVSACKLFWANWTIAG